MSELKLRAMAKINLGLDVTGVREDGYHEVKMIMQSIYLYDRIFLKITKKPEIAVSTNLSYLPANENNLAYKAAKLLIDEFEIRSGVKIEIQKYIPVAAGMAGGSTDAAAVLFGMNKLARGKTRRGCAVLHYAWDCACGGNRRKADGTAGDAALYDTDREAAGCGIYKICL